MAALAAIDRCEKDAIIRQGISPGMYRCVGTACTHAGRSSTRAGPVHGFGLAEMHGLMLDSRSCVQSAARSNDDRSPAGESPCMHNQRGRKKASLSLSHKVQECATSCLYNDTIRPVLFQDLLCHLYTHAFCAFFLPMANVACCSLITSCLGAKYGDESTENFRLLSNANEAIPCRSNS
jgi:hypothetical protein